MEARAIENLPNVRYASLNVHLMTGSVFSLLEKVLIGLTVFVHAPTPNIAVGIYKNN